MTSTDPRTRSKRAYELGRVRLGLTAALPVIPMTVLSVVLSRRAELSLTLASAALLFVAAAGLRARGQLYGRALLVGYCAGTAPFLLPLMLRGTGHCCIGQACWPVCMLGCVGSGVLAGIVIGLAAAAETERAPFLLSAALVAGLAGVLGCVMAGLSGVLGMAIAIGAISLPVSAAASTRVG